PRGPAAERPGEAACAPRAHRETRKAGLVPPVLVAWDGHLAPLAIRTEGPVQVQVHIGNGLVVPLENAEDGFRATQPLPSGYHRLTVEVADRSEASTVIAARREAWRRPGSDRSWGVGADLAALRSARSRSVGGLRDVEAP